MLAAAAGLPGVCGEAGAASARRRGRDVLLFREQRFQTLLNGMFSCIRSGGVCRGQGGGVVGGHVQFEAVACRQLYWHAGVSFAACSPRRSASLL